MLVCMKEKAKIRDLHSKPVGEEMRFFFWWIKVQGEGTLLHSKGKQGMPQASERTYNGAHR